MSTDRNLSLGEVSLSFLGTLPPDEAKASQQEINRFIRLVGAKYPVAALERSELEVYADRLSASDSGLLQELEQVKAFLGYVKKEGLIKTNLATHLKPKKGKTRGQAAGRQSAAPSSLTRGRFDELKAELETLKTKRDDVIGEIRRQRRTRTSGKTPRWKPPGRSTGG